MSHDFSRIAIVNRGEPAMRFLNAAREYGRQNGERLTTIALYTDPDRRALFVREADEAHHLGSSTFLDPDGQPKNRYLDYETLERALVETHAEAVWVGWGFVAEHAEFADLCERLGVVFIGPTGDVMRQLGDKITSKIMAERTNVPVAPWSGGAVESLEEAREAAEKLGYPLLIKATAGGGGRGIRKVRNDAELEETFERARSEARKFFGDPAVFLETLVVGAHHVEVQIIGDRYGNVWPLGVRDCTIQRRNQKIFEETPSPVLSAAQDAELRQAAARLMQAAGYRNAGTVEFLYDPAAKSFAFMEVNARLQVEHPVTELVTGADLVKMQIDMARGKRLEGEPPPSEGWAIEVRLNAEDPENAFAPAPGTVEHFRPPLGPGLRIDTGVEEGDEISSDFDSMIAKIIAHGRDRGEALSRLRRGLAQTSVVVRGGTTNKAFLQTLLEREEVLSGEIDIAWLDRLMADGEHLTSRHAEIALVEAAIEVYEAEAERARKRFLLSAARGRPAVQNGFGLEAELSYRGNAYSCRVYRLSPRHYEIAVAEGAETVRIDVRIDELGPFTRRLTVAGRGYRVFSVVQGTNHLIEVDGVPHRVSEDKGGVVRSPSPAVVVAITVEEGDEVAAGERLAVLEAMKMETAVTAGMAGKVRKILVKRNVQVGAGAPLLELEPTGGVGAEPTANRLDLARLAEPGARPTEAEGHCRHVDDLRRSILGYDVDPGSLRQILAEHGRLCIAGAPDDPENLRHEDEILNIFVDISSLARRQPTDDEFEEGVHRGSEDYLFAYLRDPGAEGAGLPERFLDNLRRTLRHYGVESLERTSWLEECLYRIYKSHQEMASRLTPIVNVLERRLEIVETLRPRTGEDFLTLLERLIAETQQRFPAVHDLAREVRYRYFDERFLEDKREQVFAEVEAHVARLAEARGEELAKRVEALVSCSQPLKTFLSRRYERVGEAARPTLLEVMTRRYYRIRRLAEVSTPVAGGRSYATVRFERGGRRFHVVTTHSDYGDLAAAAEDAAPLLEGVPEGYEKMLDFYLYRDSPTHGGDAAAGEIQEILSPFLARHRPYRVVTAISSATGGRGMGDVEHYTFRRGDNGEYVEDVRMRHLHPMMAKRLEIDRLLTHFHIERLPSMEDVYLFYVKARENPSDERLVAFAEVRDLTPVRDADGTLLKLPELERIFMESLGGIRRFQARRPERKRLHWNRVNLFIWPPFDLPPAELRELGNRLVPATEGLGLEKVKVKARMPHRGTGRLRDVVFDIQHPGSRGSLVWYRRPETRPLEPLDDYSQKVVRLRQRGLMYPYETVKMLTPGRQRTEAELPPGEFVEYDLDAENRLMPVERAPGKNTANLVIGLIRNFTERYPEGIERVILLSDPTYGMGSLAEPECRRIIAGLDLAESRGIPLEWFAVSAGAKISMESGTENMDWIALVLRRLVNFTQDGGEVNIVVHGINVGAQPYWNAEATMLMHTRGILIMTADGAMVLTGKQALDFSGGVSAEDNQGIGGYERIMGPNGQAQYFARDIGEACHLLLRHYDFAYTAPSERFPRRAETTDPRQRDVCLSPHGGDFATVGEVFSPTANPGRKKPFDIRKIMSAVIDADHEPLERWAGMRGAEIGVVWDAHLGGHPVLLLGIESKPVPRFGLIPADGPDQWTSGTLFPQSSKKIARALNAASGSRAAVILANLSGFDGSPESMRKWQLEFGAEIGRAVVNYRGPIIFCVISRYHGGAFVVFSNALHDNMEVAALEGSFASVIGGAPAAAVVFAREVKKRTEKDPRVAEIAERMASADGIERAKLEARHDEIYATVHSEKLGEMSEEFDRVHSVERARDVGSVHRIIAPQTLRPYLVEAVERGMKKELERSGLARSVAVAS